MTEIEQLVLEVEKRLTRISELRRSALPQPVQNYEFTTLEGKTSLLDLFAGKTRLFVIHNMGQGCRHCTL